MNRRSRKTKQQVSDLEFAREQERAEHLRAESPRKNCPIEQPTYTPEEIELGAHLADGADRGL